MTRTMPGRPLAGMARKFKGFSKIRVLDFSKLLPGPYATQALAEMGCRVTRVELPHSQDMSRDVPPLIDGVGCIYWMVNQGKRRMVLDFRKPEGMKKLLALIRQADVLVEGFRPGRMERMELGYKKLRKINPRLVYCSISGYNPDGPWAKVAGHDINFMAASGFLGLGNSEGRVAYPAAQLADVVGSSAAISGILAALWERQSTGKGRHVQISITDSLHSLLTIPLAYLRATEKDAALGKEWWSGAAHPFFRLYNAKDGRKLAVGAMERNFSIALLEELGLSQLRGKLNDLEKNAPELIAALSAAFASRTAADWEKLLAEKDVCVTPVYSLAEAQARLNINLNYSVDV